MCKKLSLLSAIHWIFIIYLTSVGFPSLAGDRLLATGGVVQIEGAVPHQINHRGLATQPLANRQLVWDSV
jgi:hypothetical protein